MSAPKVEVPKYEAESKFDFSKLTLIGDAIVVRPMELKM